MEERRWIVMGIGMGGFTTSSCLRVGTRGRLSGRLSSAQARSESMGWSRVDIEYDRGRAAGERARMEQRWLRELQLLWARYGE
jgi:hypothetical protein